MTTTVDPTVDLSGGAERTRTVTLVVPDDPTVRYLAVVVPITLAELEDPGVTARQVALNAAADARDTVESTLAPMVLKAREDAARGIA